MLDWLSDSLTLIIAVIGAVNGTVGMTLGLLRWQKEKREAADRKAASRIFARVSEQDPNGHHQFVVTFHNPGKVPCVINSLRILSPPGINIAIGEPDPNRNRFGLAPSPPPPPLLISAGAYFALGGFGLPSGPEAVQPKAAVSTRSASRTKPAVKAKPTAKAKSVAETKPTADMKPPAEIPPSTISWQQRSWFPRLPRPETRKIEWELPSKTEADKHDRAGSVELIAHTPHGVSWPSDSKSQTSAPATNILKRPVVIRLEFTGQTVTRIPETVDCRIDVTVEISDNVLPQVRDELYKRGLWVFRGPTPAQVSQG